MLGIKYPFTYLLLLKYKSTVKSMDDSMGWGRDKRLQVQGNQAELNVLSKERPKQLRMLQEVLSPLKVDFIRVNRTEWERVTYRGREGSAAVRPLASVFMLKEALCME